MKHLFKYILLCVGVVTFTACEDTLDTHPSSVFTDELVWKNPQTANAFVYSTYAAVLSGTGWTGGGSCVAWQARTPDGVQTSLVGEGIDGMATELGVNNESDYGANRFTLLRQCNLIIENAQKSNFADADKQGLIAEGKFLRGMVFFDQARKMGRFVPMTKVLEASDTVASRIKMTNSVAESYKYVLSDLRAGAEGLPETADAGRPTKYAADVILSRAYLQAYAYTKTQNYLDSCIYYANDAISNSRATLTKNYRSLFNNEDPTNPEILWAQYYLDDDSYLYHFNEMINTYPNISLDDQLTSFSSVTYNSGVSVFESWAIYFPTQDMVDQYLVTDDKTGEALPWNATSQFKENAKEANTSSIITAGQVDKYTRNDGSERRIPTPQDLKDTKEGYPKFSHYLVSKSGATRDLSDVMYSNRDARFAASIIYDSCANWLNVPVRTNLSGNFSQGVRAQEDGAWYNTSTGYYWRKYTLEQLNDRAFYTVKCNYHYCLARLGEAYLNLAEAQLLKGNVSEAVAALNATRMTHGKIAPSTATTTSDAWKDYIRERRVEMANEMGDIYFSYLRWGLYGGDANYGRASGDVIYDLDRPVYKVEISRDRKQVIMPQITVQGSANRHFTTKRYLLPIAQRFLNTRAAYGLDDIQNTGW